MVKVAMLSLQAHRREPIGRVKLNTNGTPRWNSVIAQLGSRTHVEQSDLKVLEDTEIRCEVEITVRQRASVERNRVTGNGHSEGTLLADTAMLGPAALSECQRLEADLANRARKWLAGAPTRVKTTASAKDFDFDVKRYAVDSGCTPCATSGKVRCTQCMQGRVQCPQCSGVKQRVCTACSGSCSVECRACSGAGQSQCKHCNGASVQHCGSCHRSGKVTCYSCGGQGYQRRYQQVVKDIGKGPFYETVEIHDSCLSCHQGKVTCPMCGGMPTTYCNHCSGGVKSCAACSGRGQISCTNCSQTGIVICNACDASGHIGCTACNATAAVACKPCGARGWTHVREDIFTRLIDETSAKWSIATPPGLVAHLNRIVASGTAEQEGSFQLQHQQVDVDPRTVVTRSWKGTVPAWAMQFEIEGKPYTVHAVGKGQQVVDIDAAVEQLLAADREGLLPALKHGGAVARRAVQRYLRSADHVAAVLDESKQPTGAARQDLQAVRAYLGRRAHLAPAAWLWSARAAAFLLCVPVLLGMRVRFDLILLLFLPLLIVKLGRFAQQRAAFRAVTKVSGSTAFAESWQHKQHRSHPSSAGNKSILLWGFVLATLTLWISPAKPLWMAYAASDLHIKWGAISGMPNVTDARTATLQDWMACRGESIDGLLTALRTLQTQTPQRAFDVQAFQRRIPERTWKPDGLVLADRKVHQLSVRATVMPGLGSLDRLAFDVRMSPITDDPQKLARELDQTSSEAINTTVGTALGFGSTGVQRSWSAQLEKSKGLGKGLRQGPTTLTVTCEFHPGDWLRLAR